MGRGARIGIVGVVWALLAASAAGAAPGEVVPNGGPVQVGRWSVDVSVEPAVVGPVGIEVGVARVGKFQKRAMGANIRYENLGRKTLTFGDTRRSAFAKGGSGDQLLAADEGCGWSIDNPGDPIQPGACQLYLDTMVLESRASDTRHVAGIWGLSGMTALSAGHYEFDRRLVFQVGDAERSQRERITVSFDVTRTP